MESLEAQTEAVKATFQNLANDVIDSELIGSILKLSKGFLELIDTGVGPTITRFTLLTGVLTGGITIFGSIAGKLVSMAKAGTTLVSVLTGTATGFGTVAAAALPVAGIIAGIAVGAYALYKAWKKANPTLEEATDNLDGLNSQLQTNQDRLKEINEMPWNERTQSIMDEKAAIEDENEALADQIEYYKEKQKAVLEDKLSKGITLSTGETRYTATSPYGTDPALGGVAAKEVKQITEEEVAHYKELGWAIDETNKKMVYQSDEVLGALTSRVDTLTQSIEDGTYANNQWSGVMYDEVVTALKDQIQYLELSGQDASIYKDQLNKLTSTQEFYANNTVLTNETVASLTKRFPELSSAITTVDGKYVLLGTTAGDTANALISQDGRILASSKNRAAQDIANLEAEIEFRQGYLTALMQTPYSSTDPDAAYQKSLRASAVSQLQSLLDVKNKLFWAQKKTQELGYYDDTDDLLGGGTDGSTGTKTLTDSALTNFQSYYKDLQHLRNTDEIDQAEYLKRLQVLVDNYTKDATANMKAYGTDSKTIAQNMYQYQEELINGWADVQKAAVEAAKAAAEEAKSNLETALSYVTDTIDKQISALEEEKTSWTNYYDAKIDSLQEVNDELNNQLDLQEKLEALAKAQSQKRLVYKDGKFQYVSDIDAVSAAQSDLEATQQEQEYNRQVKELQEAKDAKLDALDEEIKGWQKYNQKWEDAVDDYTKNQDKLIAEQTLGSKLESDILNQRLSTVKEFVAAYNAAMLQIEEAQSIPEGGWQTGVNEGVNVDSSNVQTNSSLGFDPNTDYSLAIKNATSASQKAQLETERQNKIDAMYGGVDPAKKHASGTTSAPGGISLVGEGGAELRVLNQGDGIIPADVTRNLWSWGMTTPSAMLNVLGKMGNTMSTTLSIANVTLPGVKDAPSFITGLKSLAVQYAAQRT